MKDQTPGGNPALVVRQAGAATDTVVVLSTAPDELLAKRIAHVLVEESLVACAQVGPAIVSMYLWQGELEGTDEVQLLFKTTADTLPALYERLCALHPYEIPEFMVLGVPAGSRAYLDWVAQSTRPALQAATREA
ncbi:divalent-cation tolerance protein CutA [Castellaniella defragrans]|uniref:Periplasmic divalent cation tolerance protein n=1 Tax=Castellaniella defragrans TaxID=75697 RepID=A0A7W9TNY2_CASDE|nr:divalent-cation tolerance protein CutA [Castellaniella defragrans]KAB0615653.1 divalent-cation tolerance protein CutA [Castellaniella defragrans]MBB6084014.1 periplasmic divalent cation tolerance protein [Castellaniella defragrans]